MIDKFIENLEGLKKAIENEDGKKLEEIFTKTQKIRKELLKITLFGLYLKKIKSIEIVRDTTTKGGLI